MKRNEIHSFSPKNRLVPSMKTETHVHAPLTSILWPVAINVQHTDVGQIANLPRFRQVRNLPGAAEFLRTGHSVCVRGFHRRFACHSASAATGQQGPKPIDKTVHLASAAIVTGERAADLERLAAKEVQRYLHRISGIVLPLAGGSA